MDSQSSLSPAKRKQISEILRRRANEIASFHTQYTKDPQHFGSVEFALTREISRLRDLADSVCPPSHDEDEEV